jgi:hypothetical protein
MEITWTDTCNVKILTNTHYPTAWGNLCDVHGNGIKPTIIKRNKQNM